MHLGRTKNMLILMLLLVNIALAGLLGMRFFDDARARVSMHQQVIDLLADRGISVTRLPDEQTRIGALVVPRSYDAEALSVGSLLGEASGTPRGGGITDYQAALGSALFRADGRFEIHADQPVGSNMSGASIGELSGYSLTTMQGMGLLGLSDEARVERRGDGQAVIFGQSVMERPVFNARAELFFDGGGNLSQVSGLWCFGAAQPESGDLCKSAGAVLLEYSADSDGQTLEVVDIQLGYRLRTYLPDTARLAPEWRIICTDRELYLDAYTAVPVSE